MTGKNRFSSEEQSTTISTFSQDSFAGGLNTDRPASEIGAGELAKADNVHCFPQDIIGRSGTTLFQNRALPGTGTIHAIKFHQSSKRWLLHRGSKLWAANASMNGYWDELKDISSQTSFGIDLSSSITENRENFIISTASGIFTVLISDTSTVFTVYQANTPPPDMAIGGQVNTDETHKYRIVYTYVRMTGITTDGRITPGAVMEQETGSVNIINADDKDYSLFPTADPISAENPLTVVLAQGFTVNTGTDELALTESYRTGDTIVFTTTGTLPSPLLEDTVYYAINSADVKTVMQVATTKANAFAGTQIDITDTGTGSQTVRSNWFSNTKIRQHTHIGVYMTNDLGSQIIDPKTNTGFNTEEYVWIKDVTISKIGDSFTPSTFTIDIDQDVWTARAETGGFGLETRQWAALPSGNLGEVAMGWFFTANTGETFTHYSQINDSGLKGVSIGYYNEAKQRHKLQDGITAFVDIGDYLVVSTSNKTYSYRLNSFHNVGTTLAAVFQLTTPSRLDDTIGIIDPGTIAQISEGRFMAVCSDASVRIFETTRWGADLSLDKVKKSEIRKMQVGSVAAYWQGAYFLWYRKDSTDTHNENTLRLAVENGAGEGWTTYSGDNWIKPPLNTGAINFVDDNDIQRIVVIDFESLRPYWIETFNGFTGSGLTQTFIDKSDDPGICILGKTYLYDALDDSSFDTSKFSADTTGNGSLIEDQSLGFYSSEFGSADLARAITVDSIGGGDDFEISVNLTDDFELYSTVFGDILWVELKLAAFASPGDDLEVGTLAGDGIYIYLKVTSFLDGGSTDYTFQAFWKVVRGSDTYSGSTVVFPPLPTSGDIDIEFKITLVDQTITWFFNGDQMDFSQDISWRLFGPLKGSFSASDEGSGSAAAFNFFSLVSASGMPNKCIGLDGEGDDTTPGRSTSAAVKTREIIGQRETNIKTIQEAHAYLRPASESDGFPSTFKVNAKDYIDGSVTENETVNNVDFKGDIEFFKDATGRRLQAEFITNSTDFRMVSFDVDYIEKREQSEDRIVTTATGTTYTDTLTTTDQEGYYSEMTKVLAFLVSRYDYTLELSQGVRAANFKVIQISNNSSSWSGELGPDGKALSAVSVDYGDGTNTLSFASNKFTASAAFKQFAFSFWVQDPNIGTKIFQISQNTKQYFYITFNSSTEIDFSGLFTVTLDDVTLGWNNIWVLRTGDQITIYQNKVSKGSFTFAASTKFGGDNFNIVIDGDSEDCEIFDFRLYIEDITVFIPVLPPSIAALGDYYDDVIGNEGRIYLP